MAESRRDYIYVSERDTGLPSSPPPTPAWGIGDGDRSGNRYDETAFGKPLHLDENALQNAHGSTDGGLDEPPRYAGGCRKVGAEQKLTSYIAFNVSTICKASKKYCVYNVCDFLYMLISTYREMSILQK